jgi:hypothetical protein
MALAETWNFSHLKKINIIKNNPRIYFQVFYNMFWLKPRHCIDFKDGLKPVPIEYIVYDHLYNHCNLWDKNFINKLFHSIHSIGVGYFRKCHSDEGRILFTVNDMSSSLLFRAEKA